jgi:hypothetical protein
MGCAKRYGLPAWLGPVRRQLTVLLRSGAPEVIAPVWLGRVAVRARIDDELLAESGALAS